VKVSLAPEAEQDLVEGALFYAREANTELGQAFISEFERSAAILGEQPRLGAVWRGHIRRLPLRRFPYSIVYYLNRAGVRVLAVAHQSRKPGFWRGRS
jgi:plasmid stabilization system protein ParE